MPQPTANQQVARPVHIPADQLLAFLALVISFQTPTFALRYSRFDQKDSARHQRRAGSCPKPALDLFTPAKSSDDYFHAGEIARSSKELTLGRHHVVLGQRDAGSPPALAI